MITATDVLNGTIPNFKCTDPDTLMLFEFREDELSTGSGLHLIHLSTQKFNQLGVLPKWRVLAVGDNVTNDIGIKKGDHVIVSRLSGRLRSLSEVQVRIIHKYEVLARVQYEPSDFKFAFKY